MSSRDATWRINGLRGLLAGVGFRFGRRKGGPDPRELERDCIEGLGVNRFLAAVRVDQHPATRFETQNLERPREGVDEPDPRHALASIDPEFARPIDLLG